MESQTDAGRVVDRQTDRWTDSWRASRQINRCPKAQTDGAQAHRVPYNYNPSTVEVGQEDHELAVACLK